MADVSLESHGIHVPEDVQAHILDYMSYAEVQRLRATGPVFLHAALRARHRVICLDFTQVMNKKKSPIRRIRRLRRYNWIPSLVTRIELHWPRGRACGVYPARTEANAAVSDLIRVLPRMHNVRELSFKRPSNDSYLQFNQICDALAAARPQLTRLRIEEMRRSDADSIVAKLIPWVENLQELALDIVRDFQKDGATATSLECVVQQLIAPARNSLVQLKLHIYTLDSLIMSPLILEAHEEWIGIMFGALARLRLARLRSLYVRTPLRGALSGSEEVPLARFIQAHALEQLDVQPSALSGCRQFKNDWAAKHYRLLSLLTPLSNQYLQEMTLHVEEPLRRNQERGLIAVVDFLAAIRGPLSSLSLLGQDLQPNEIIQIVGAAHAWSGTLAHLRIRVEIIRPTSLMALASALPNLHVLELTTRALYGATRRFGDYTSIGRIDPYTGELPPKSLNGTDPHYTQWMKNSVIEFIDDMYAHPYCIWTLRRLSIQVLVTPSASSDLNNSIPIQTIRKALEKANPSLIDVTIDFVSSPISKHSRK